MTDLREQFDNGPFISFMLRIGRLKFTNQGVWIKRDMWSVNRKIRMRGYCCVFTGEREHARQYRKEQG